MALRNDITVNWLAVPRVVTIATPSVALTIQDLYDTLRKLEADLSTGLQFNSILTAAGKDNLGGGLQTGITLTLSNTQLAFAARSGPAYAQCVVSGGNLIAVDASGVAMSAIFTTAFTQIIISQSTSAALLSSGTSQAAAVWDEPASSHVTAGTMGGLANAGLTIGQFIAIK